MFPKACSDCGLQHLQTQGNQNSFAKTCYSGARFELRADLFVIHEHVPFRKESEILGFLCGPTKDLQNPTIASGHVGLCLRALLY